MKPCFNGNSRKSILTIQLLLLLLIQISISQSKVILNSYNMDLSVQNPSNSSSIIFQDDFSEPDGPVNASIYTQVSGEWFYQIQQLRGNWSIEEWVTCTTDISFPLQDVVINFDYQVIEWYPGLSLLSFELTSDPDGRRFIDFYEEGYVYYSNRIGEPEYQFGFYDSSLPFIGHVTIFVDLETSFKVYLNDAFVGNFTIPTINAGNVGFGVYNSHIAFDNLLIQSAFEKEPPTQTYTESFVEGFDTTQYHDSLSTDALGWGTGEIHCDNDVNLTLHENFYPSREFQVVEVAADLAYIGFQKDSHNGGLTILNVSDPNDPIEISSVPYTISSFYLYPVPMAMDIQLYNEFVFISGGGYIIDHDKIVVRGFLWVLDVTDPNSPSSLHLDFLPIDLIDNKFEMTVEFNSGGLSISTAIWKNWLYICVGSGVFTDLFKVDITDPVQPLSIVEIGESAFHVEGVTWRQIAVFKDFFCALTAPPDFAYDLSQGLYLQYQGRLCVLNLSAGIDPYPDWSLFFYPKTYASGIRVAYPPPSIGGHLTHDLCAGDEYLYLTYDYLALKIIDFQNWPEINIIGEFKIPNFDPFAAGMVEDVWNIDIEGDYAAIMSTKTVDLMTYDVPSFHLIDIKDPTKPNHVGSFTDLWEMHNFCFFSNHIYLCTSWGFLNIELGEVIYKSPSEVQSKLIFSGSSLTTLTNVTLFSTHIVPDNTSIEHYLSADNGSNWELVHPGINHYFIYSGRNLKWRVLLKTIDPDFTPIIQEIEIVFRYEIIQTTDFSLISPIDGFKIADPSPIFYWEAVPEISDYLWEIDSDSSFADPINETLTSTTLKPTNPLEDGLWYWRVATLGLTGKPELYSPVYDLMIDTNPPKINHSVDRIVYNQGNVGHKITWNGSDLTPAYYVILRDCVTIQNNTWNGEDISFNVDGLFWGNYTFTCIVADELGHSTSDSVFISVLKPTDTSPNIPTVYVTVTESATGFQFTLLIIAFVFIRLKVKKRKQNRI